jgi:hypothetical protein
MSCLRVKQNLVGTLGILIMSCLRVKQNLVGTLGILIMSCLRVKHVDTTLSIFLVYLPDFVLHVDTTLSIFLVYLPGFVLHVSSCTVHYGEYGFVSMKTITEFYSSRFYAKKSYSFQLRREARNFGGISCEKSRFYAKKY